MENVKIPDGFFLAEAKKEYYDYKSRHLVELLQNSVDAGASEIYFNFGDNDLEIIDNGRGMSKQRMVDALLTMGGSIKTENSVGGFGAAKKLILYSHKNYIIHSLDTYVEGSVLQYKFVNCTYFNGTRVKVEFLPEYRYDKEISIDKLKEALKSCNLNTSVYINGEKFTDWKVLPFRKDYGWCKLYASDTIKGHSYIHIRKNGLQMFSTYVNDLNRDVYIEVNGSSLDLFTQNRDRFTGEIRDKFSALISEISVDKNSFVRSGKSRFIIYKGRERFWRNIVESLNIPISESIFDSLASITDIQEAISLLTNSNIKSSDVDKMISVLEERINKKDIFVDFVIDLGSSDLEECPKAFTVGPMLRKNRFLAILWKNCLMYIAKITNTNINFQIGWIFDNDCKATYQYKNNVDIFLINPTQEFASEYKDYVYQVMSIACHEFAHYGWGDYGRLKYHDENFAASFTFLVSKVFASFSWREVYEETKKGLDVL